jgi:tRNA(Ile)-lysidine synthase
MNMNSKFDWQQGAIRLAAAIPRDRLDPAVLAWVDASDTRRVWGVAFSGGPDSLALLLLLWAHFPKRRRRLVALHFDHGLRGADSRADAIFCRQVCARLRLRLVAGKWTRASRAQRPTIVGGGDGKAGVSEAEARAARHDFLGKHARAIWFGHQMDDIAESILMRLARGSGAGGLAAPRPVQLISQDRVHLRPLITLRKAEIVGALQEAGIAWREDLSNAGKDFFRNRIRHEVIPCWTQAARRDALAGAARSRGLLEEDDAALEGWVTELDAVDGDGALILRNLVGKPRAVLRRALHRWLLRQRMAGELSRQAFEVLLAAVEKGSPTRQSMGREGFAVLRRGVLRFESAGRTFRRGTN